MLSVVSHSFLTASNKVWCLVKSVPAKCTWYTVFKDILTQEVSAFFKKRAIIEDEYGKTLQKLARSTSEVYAVNDGKAGSGCLFLCCFYLLSLIHRSFVLAWQTSMRIHEMMAENRLRFAQRLNEMSDELNNLGKEVDKNRKQV